MFETMHHDIHNARERDLLHTAEMYRASKVLRDGRKRKAVKHAAGGFGFVYDVLRALREAAYALNPNHELGAGK